jgi:hypothetical protein
MRQSIVIPKDAAAEPMVHRSQSSPHTLHGRSDYRGLPKRLPPHLDSTSPTHRRRGHAQPAVRGLTRPDNQTDCISPHLQMHRALHDDYVPIYKLSL